MFFLYGTKTFFKKKGESKQVVQCEHCGHVGKWDYKTGRTWGTLFFVPLIPTFYKKSYLMCPACEYGYKITRKNREEMMAKIDLTL
jgi:DNA-directed RNA polymerase subunit RPC12/RpoP